MSRGWNRREFTRHVGLTTLFSPFVSLFDPTPVQAAAGRAKYLCIFFTNGTEPSVWSPRGSSETRINFSAMTEPLAPLRANLTLIEQLSSLGTADNHAAPGGLTGQGYSGRDFISVDQFVSDGLRAAGIRRPIPNLVLGGVENEQLTTFYRGGTALSPIYSPRNAYETIFSGATPGDTGGDSNAGAADLLRRRRSVLDLVRGELNQLAGALGAQERQKLELHADSIRQLEERLAPPDDPGNGSGVGAGGCSSPPVPAGASQPLLNASLHLDLAITAFACDITRVAAIQFGHHQSTQLDLPDVGEGDWHNSFLHGNQRQDGLPRLERWLCQQFVAGAEKMKSLPAPDGSGTLFDQTLFVWARDMGDAVAHNGNDMRFVFSGGAGGYLRTSPEGRYLQGGGEGHARALLNCCEAMGVTNFADFGDPNASPSTRTPLPELCT